ncbi:MAG: hypothetical protein Tsb0020_46230 [Haliangiales bacterium]
MLVDIGRDDKNKMIVVAVSREFPTLFFVPHGIAQAYSTSAEDDFVVEEIDGLLGIRLTGLKDRGSLTIITDLWQIGVILVVVDDPDKAIKQVAFRDVDRRLELGREIFYQPGFAPEAAEREDRGPIRLTVGEGRQVHEDLYYQVTLATTGPHPARVNIGHIDAFIGDRRIENARLELVDPAVAGGTGVTAVLRPDQPKPGVLFLPGAGGQPEAPLTIQIHGVNGRDSSKVTVREWHLIDPNTPLSEVDHRALMLELAGDLTAAGSLPQERWTNGRDAISFSTSFLAYGSEIGLITFEVTNEGRARFPVGRIEIQDISGEDLTQEVTIVGRSPGDVETAIAPNETITIAAVFRDAPRVQRGGIQLKLFPIGGGTAASASSVKIYRKPNKGRNSVLGQAAWGGMSLRRGDDSQLVSAWSVGGQFIRGVAGQFSLDVGVNVLTGGEAELEGVVYSETLYRVSMGLRYFFTESGWQPYFRLGGGAALVSAREGDDSSLDLGSFGQLGGGVMRYAGDTLVFGVEAIAERVLDGGGSSIMLNAVLGFAWGGNEWE